MMMRPITTVFAHFIVICLATKSFAGVPQPTADAQDDFYTFWTDGDARNVSESRLYFTNKAGDHVWELRERMTGDMGKPTIVEFRQQEQK